MKVTSGDEPASEPPGSGPVHHPVLVDRVVALLAPALEQPGSVLVDATLGLGGHSRAILDTCPRARVVGVDRDEQALAVARTRLSGYGERVTFVHAVYDQIPRALADLGVPYVDGVLFDLGVSSLQLDDSGRGFSYSADTALDMRMDQSSALTAADVVNTYSVQALSAVLRNYGEERFASRIARTIVDRRPLTSTAQLVDAVRDSVPAPARRTGGHPAKRTFQALRIEVNDELGALERALPAAIDALAVGGRIVVMSYQSLEDRLVKRTFAQRTVDDVPLDLPVTGSGPELKLLTRGGEPATDAEIEANPRSASVRLRAAQRIRAAGSAA